jgi:hypothetical protein
MRLWSRAKETGTKIGKKAWELQEQVSGSSVLRGMESLETQLATILVGMDRAIQEAEARAARAERRSRLAIGIAVAALVATIALCLVVLTR